MPPSVLRFAARTCAALLAIAAVSRSREALAQTAPVTSTTPAQTGATAGTSSQPAQPPSREAEARTLFEQGVAALADERYSDALTAFARSYEIRRVASVALNLGISLRALGRLTEARARFTEFIEMASPAQHERHDREVANYLADVNRRIARIHIERVEPEQARVLVDGRRVSLDERDELAVDPGEHTVEAQLNGYTGTPQRVSLEPGGRTDVRLILTAVQPDPRVTITQPPPVRQPGPSSPPRSITSSPWLWVGVGAAVVAAIAIPTAIVLSNQEATLPGTFCLRTDGSRCATGGL